MQITESTKEKIRSGLLSALLGGLGFVALAIVKETSTPFANYVVTAISSTTLLWLSLLLFLTSLFLGVWLAFLVFGDKAARVRKNYQHLERRGFWVHCKTGQRVCGNCLITGIESPLACFSFVYPNGQLHRSVWVCGRKDCGSEYPCEKGDVKDDTERGAAPNERGCGQATGQIEQHGRVPSRR